MYRVVVLISGTLAHKAWKEWSALDWMDLYRNGTHMGGDLANYADAKALADGIALQYLLSGAFVSSTLVCVFSKSRLEAGGYLSSYTTTPRNVLERLTERITRVLEG